jgi:solute carrier family 24 (sodium/potassium/calcium exchanger), member 6
LKAFGVILGISDAILGLTIFAVGSSLGDLVANITVAKLGYPVMALSACFGGPMLNILLGIGLSGLYVTLRHGTKYHAKHPKRPMKYKPFEIEVSTTLVISGVTLLTTLVGLLIFVPLNGWRMDRKVGWGLIALWSLSTIGNVVVEILGYGGEWAASVDR